MKFACFSLDQVTNINRFVFVWWLTLKIYSCLKFQHFVAKVHTSHKQTHFFHKQWVRASEKVSKIHDAHHIAVLYWPNSICAAIFMNAYFAMLLQCCCCCCFFFIFLPLFYFWVNAYTLTKMYTWKKMSRIYYAICLFWIIRWCVFFSISCRFPVLHSKCWQCVRAKSVCRKYMPRICLKWVRDKSSGRSRTMRVEIAKPEPPTSSS